MLEISSLCAVNSSACICRRATSSALTEGALEASGASETSEELEGRQREGGADGGAGRGIEGLGDTTGATGFFGSLADARGALCNGTRVRTRET